MVEILNICLYPTNTRNSSCMLNHIQGIVSDIINTVKSNLLRCLLNPELYYMVLFWVRVYSSEIPDKTKLILFSFSPNIPADNGRYGG